MKNINKYGFVSGGYIFDLLDRAALKTVNKQYPETANQQIYTQWCEIFYCKQLCDTSDTKVLTDLVESRIPGEFWVINNSLWRGNILIAHAQFWFKKTTKNFCKIKN